MSAATAATNMMNRLSFANDMGAKYASMLAFPCTAQQFSSGYLDTVMSVTTRLLPWEVTSATGGTHSSFPGGEAAYTEYRNKLNLRSIHFGEDMKAAENQVGPASLAPTPAVGSPPSLRACSGFHFPRFNQQRHLLHWPSPRLRPVYAELHEPHPRPRSLWSRCHSWRCSVASGGAPACSSPLSLRCSAHALANAFRRASRSRRLATRWCRSSSRSTRRWCTPRSKQRRCAHRLRNESSRQARRRRTRCTRV